MLHDVLTALRDWSAPTAGSPARSAFATVVQVHGSAPLPAGTLMAVREDGVVAGAVSGGCVEQQVVDAARKVAAGGPAVRLRFAPSTDPLVDTGLPCGGGIDVLVEAWGPSAAQRAFADAVLAGRAATLVSESTLERGLVLVEAAPRRRVVLIGAGLVADAVAELAGGLAWDVVVVDPREAFVARAGAAPGVAGEPGGSTIVEWPAQALPSLALGRADALVALSHHPALDDEALAVALGATDGPGFIGALGSRRSHAERLSRLRERGLGEAALARIVGPVGLDLGGWTPREIALAVVAELVAVQHGRSGGRLATARGPIHAVPGAADGPTAAATPGSLRVPEEAT